MATFWESRVPESGPLLTQVKDMVHNPIAQTLAGNCGMRVQNVSWEDNGRNPKSAWGPCISDMTLRVSGTAMPVIRFPNYEDLTCDIPVEKIQLMVGNERDDMESDDDNNNTGGAKFRVVTLKEYLENFRTHLHTPSSWKGTNNSLYCAEKDSHAIVSAQACFLPVEKGGEANFNVALYNYQSERGDPTVLSIVATSKGTSAQVVENTGYGSGQNLYFNKSGKRCSFVGQRVSDFRRDQGVASVDGPMTDEEKKDNVVMIIQVPLKKRKKAVFSFGSSVVLESYTPQSFGFGTTSAARSRGVDVEDAIVKVGAPEGPFIEVNDLEIERDERFPVRVTLQFYKTTSNGEVNEPIMKQIYDQITAVHANASHRSADPVRRNVGWRRR